MGVVKSMTLRGGGPTLSVTMTLIFPKIVWTCPLRPAVAGALARPCFGVPIQNFLSLPSYV